jgi:hypothetical protein
MLVTETLTIGQITFIFRLIIQLLSYGGLFLFGLIIVASAPRIAPLSTHDVLNRLVGQITATKSSVVWMASYITGRSGDRSFPKGLVMSIFLFTIYSSLVNLSDVGFLGIESCTTAWPTYNDFPLSVRDAVSANASVTASMINGTDPASVRAFRCDSSELHPFNANVSEYVCTNWQNGTYSDHSFFQNLNTTDSAILMNRQLKNVNTTKKDVYLNSFYNGPGSSRVEETIVSNGLLIQPRTTGFTAIVGVPELSAQQSIRMEHAMAIEGDMACLNLGLFTEKDLDALGSDSTFDIFATNWSRHYAGPEEMRPVLEKYGEKIRALVRPLFNESSINSLGYLLPNGFGDVNATDSPLGGTPDAQAKIVPWDFPDNSTTGAFNFTAVSPQTTMMANCTVDMNAALDISYPDGYTNTGMTVDSTCRPLAIRGSFPDDQGFALVGLSRFLCASTAQVNLVNANVATDNETSISMDFERVESDLHYTIASWWDTQPVGEDTAWVQFQPYERYTLSPSPGSGKTNHHIYTSRIFYSQRPKGVDSAGTILSMLGSLMITYPGAILGDNTGLTLLDDGEKFIDFNETMIPTWAGGMGAAFIRETIGYNGWAALDAAKALSVTSTGGKPAICYDLRYGIAFIPLILAAVVTLFWGLVVLIRSAFKGAKMIRELYGGISPLRVMLVPSWAAKDAVLIWQTVPEPHLENLPDGKNVSLHEGNAGGTAAEYLRHHAAPDVSFVELEQMERK